MTTYDIIEMDRQGKLFSMAYMTDGNRVWFVSYFDHGAYTDVTTHYFHRIGEAA